MGHPSEAGLHRRDERRSNVPKSPIIKNLSG